MKQALDVRVIDALAKLQQGTGLDSARIAKALGVPLRQLTPVLTRLHNDRKIARTAAWSAQFSYTWFYGHQIGSIHRLALGDPTRITG